MERNVDARLSGSFGELIRLVSSKTCTTKKPPDIWEALIWKLDPVVDLSLPAYRRFVALFRNDFLTFPDSDTIFDRSQRELKNIGNLTG